MPESVYKINDIFLEEELLYINNTVNEFYINIVKNKETEIDARLGRLLIGDLKIKPEIQNKLEKIIKELYNLDLKLSNSGYSEYNSKYGQPNLPPHFDGDHTKLIVNFQLSSNTEWNIGIDLDVYKLEDNSATIFNPNKNVHWRPIKDFKDGEYVKMIFFRFVDIANMEPNIDLRYSIDHEIFKDINSLRDSLSQ